MPGTTREIELKWEQTYRHYFWDNQRNRVEGRNIHADIIPGTTIEIELKVGTNIQTLFMGQKIIKIHTFRIDC